MDNQFRIGSPSIEEIKEYFSRLPKIVIPFHFPLKSDVEEHQNKSFTGEPSDSEDELSESFKEYLINAKKNQVKKQEASIKSLGETSINIGTPSLKEKKKNLQVNSRPDFCNRNSSKIDSSFEEFMKAEKIEMNKEKEDHHVAEKKNLIPEEGAEFQNQ